MRWIRSIHWLQWAAIFLAGLFAIVSAHGQAAGWQQLRGHVPPAVLQLNAVGRLAATNRLKLAIGLPLRNTNALAALLSSLYSAPLNGQSRHFLTPEEFIQRFGPTEKEYQAVIAFAGTNGFTISATHRNRMLLDVEAAVPDIERAFHINLRTYAHPREARLFYAPDTEPSLKLATPVLHISGLDSFTIPHPLSHERHPGAGPAQATPQTGSGPGGTLAGNDFRAAYVPGVTLDGSGQSVALLQFDGYYPADIQAYEQTFGLSTNIPVWYELLGGISSINTGAGDAEAALDIEMVLSMATNLSSVITYLGNSADDILNQIADDNLAKQVSSSWIYAVDSTTLQIYQQLAAQGQSCFNAAGDYDAYAGSPDAPSDAPYLTSVGGTTLTTAVSGGTWVSETAWNFGTGTGTGGGISTTYSLPKWQQGISMTANGGSTTMRNLPDVAMAAQNIWVIYNNGSSGNFYGTSCASPLWAGFMALVNQQALTNGFPPVGFLNPAIYAIGKSANYTAAFHDITTGNNTSSSSPNEFYAVPGYDLCTGWGTPNGLSLINALAIPDPLGVTPASGFVSSGPVGGPFSQTNLTFTLTNSGTAALNWSLVNTSVWLNAGTAGGSLPAGTATTVSLSVNAAATHLAPGYYPATVIFSNLNSGNFQANPFNLVVGVGLAWNSGPSVIAPRDGSGSWTNQSAAHTNWWNGSGNLQWNNGGPDMATFGVGSGTAGTVTVSGGVTVGGINFNAPGSGSYTISGSGTLTLNGNVNANVSASLNAPLTLGQSSTLTVASSRTLTISNLIAGSSANDLTIAGSGTVNLTAQNNTDPSLGLGGSVYVNSGTLSVGGGNSEYGALGNIAGISVAAGATLSLQSDNALSGYYNNAARNVTLNGGTLTAVNGNHQVNLLTLNGGTVSGSGGAPFGSINLDNDCYVTANSTISALNFTLDTPNGAFYISTNATLTFSGTLADNTAGGYISSLTLSGGGAMVMSGTNSYSGNTTVENGTLEVDGALGNTPVAMLGGKLAGVGKIAGAVVVESNAWFSPGPANTTGTLAISNQLSLAGTTLMQLNRTNAQNCTRVTGITTLTNGGSLILSNLGPALQDGDSFQLFSAGTYHGNFAMLSLPVLGTGLVWDASRLAQTGSLAVASLPAVNLTPASTNLQCGTTLTLTAVAAGTRPLSFQWYDFETNAIPGATNTSLTLTNLHMSQAGNYAIVVTNSFGSVSATVTVGVVDTEPPMITECVPPQTLVATTNSSASLPDLTGLIAATDNCSVALNITQTPPSGSLLPIGVTNVILRVDDGNGNTNTCSTTVTVLDQSQLLIVAGGIAPGGGFKFSFEGFPGLSYRVLASSNLLLPVTNWTAISTGDFNAGLTSVTNFGATNSLLQFYRIVSP